MRARIELRTEYTRERLQVRARTLSQNYRTEVEWAGAAYTDGEKIYLPGRGHPHIDELGDVEKLVSLHALDIHEAAHLRYSSWKVLDQLSKLPMEERELGKHVLNILEDSRVELLISNSHPGTADYLRFFNNLALENWLPSLEKVLGGAEQFLHALAQNAISGRIKGRPEEEVQELLDEVEPLIQEARRSTDPWKPLEVARHIVKRIEEKWGLPKPPTILPFRLAEFSGCKNSPKEAEKNAKRDLTGRSIEELHPGEGKGGGEEKSRGGKGERESGKGKKDGEEKAGRPEDREKTVGSDTSPGDIMPEGLAERVKAELKRTEKEVRAKEKEIKLDGTTLGDFKAGGQIKNDLVEGGDRAEYARICAEIAPLKKPMTRRLKDMLAAKTRITRGLKKGKLDPTRIHRVALGREDVFYKRNSRSAKSVGFLLLIDESGSMGNSNRYLHARKAAVLFSEVLRELKVRHMVMGFTADQRGGLSTDHLIYRTFSERHSRASTGIATIYARMNNRDSTSIRVATEYLARQRFHKKVLVVISDGEPYARGYFPPKSVKDTAKAVREARRKGIRVIGVSIDPGAGNYLHEIYPSRVVVKRLRELPAKLLKVARRELA